MHHLYGTCFHNEILRRFASEAIEVPLKRGVHGSREYENERL